MNLNQTLRLPKIEHGVPCTSFVLTAPFLNDSRKQLCLDMIFRESRLSLPRELLRSRYHTPTSAGFQTECCFRFEKDDFRTSKNARQTVNKSRL